MVRVFLLAAMLLFFPLLRAQQGISYAYDASGNRVERTIVLGTRSTASDSADTVAVIPPVNDNTPSSPFFEESPGGRRIRIYPNPVEFELSISIPDYEPAMRGEYSLFNLNGVMLLRRRITGTTTQIEMSRYPKGIYLLHIRLKDAVTVWKVIKR